MGRGEFNDHRAGGLLILLLLVGANEAVRQRSTLNLDAPIGLV